MEVYFDKVDYFEAEIVREGKEGIKMILLISPPLLPSRRALLLLHAMANGGGSGGSSSSSCVVPEKPLEDWNVLAKMQYLLQEEMKS